VPPVSPQPPAESRLASSTSARLRIIVADDDRDTVLTLTSLLKEEGHDVRGLYNGDQVLATVQEFDPDALILDIAMPGQNGYDLAKHLKQARGEAKRPALIGISGIYKQGADKILARIVGFDKFLTKPYSIEAVLAALAQLTSDQSLKA
jgi:DNA-binding response OmpR family regulator